MFLERNKHSGRILKLINSISKGDGMGLADLHIHSIHSYDGTSTIPAILKHTAENTHLNVIAITDHDSMDGVNQALDLAPAYGLEVIPGCEISSADGHVLGLFLKNRVPAGLSLIETLLLIGEQGGLAVAAHPMARGTSSLSFEVIQQACNHPFASKILVGVEAFNGGLVYTRSNRSIAEQSSHLPLSQVGNSDAHILQMIGQGASFFPGNTAMDVRIALKERQTWVAAYGNLRGVQVLTSYLPKYFLRMLGWAVWNENPAAPLKYARINNLTPRPSTHVGELLHQMIYEY
jgi:predicted metal-dependent phosphoesterase TrpH